MKITQKALDKINTLEPRLRLAMLFKVGERRIQQIIDANKNNGPLTTAAALVVIREETGLPDSQILFEEAKHKHVA